MIPVPFGCCWPTAGTTLLGLADVELPGCQEAGWLPVLDAIAPLGDVGVDVGVVVDMGVVAAIDEPEAGRDMELGG